MELEFVSLSCKDISALEFLSSFYYLIKLNCAIPCFQMTLKISRFFCLEFTFLLRREKRAIKLF